MRQSFYLLLCTLIALTCAAGDTYQGKCLEGWIDGSLVDLGNFSVDNLQSEWLSMCYNLQISLVTDQHDGVSKSHLPALLWQLSTDKSPRMSLLQHFQPWRSLSELDLGLCVVSGGTSAWAPPGGQDIRGQDSGALSHSHLTFVTN